MSVSDVLGAQGGDLNNTSDSKYLSQISPEEINNLSRSELRDRVPSNWDIREHNGRIHIRDSKNTMRIRTDPPDRGTNFPHMHVYDGNKNPLDIFGNVVDRRSPEAHIPWDR
jgi:hypothetical protein